MKIGLVGEAPHDTNSILNLLSRQPLFAAASFTALINDIHGSMLDNQKTKHILRKQFDNEKPDRIIFIRDLDSLEDNELALDLRKEYFLSFNSVVDYKGIFLLNIYEIEALIISDLTTFNQFFNCNVIYEADPMALDMPKEFLKKNCKKYTETVNPEIFKHLVFETILQNCKYFREFITKLQGILVKE